MTNQNDIYYEPQSGGLCRKHSLNGYFGYAKISTVDFTKYQKQYDIEYKQKFNFESDCSTFDIIASDQKNIVSYILKKHGVYSRYYSINQIFQKNIDSHIFKILYGDFFFIYNESHIYGARLKNDKWYNVNSIGGISRLSINRLTSQKNLGFIVPVDIKTEFYHNITLIKSILGPNQELQHIKDFLIKKNKEKLILGHLEIPLGICMDIIDTQYAKKIHNKFNKPNEFSSIHNEVIKYNRFLSEFTKGRYNDIELIIQHIPSIILRLTFLTQPKNQ
jgi:hypothetical protein